MVLIKLWRMVKESKGDRERKEKKKNVACEHRRRSTPRRTTERSKDGDVQHDRDHDLGFDADALRHDERTLIKTEEEVEVVPGSGDGSKQATVLTSGRCQICRAEKRAARIYRWKLIVGLFFPYIISSMDLTITATALPFIASHFNRLDQLNWIVTAFTLTSTSFIPAFGQLADVFGRHAILQLTMILNLIGSALCAGAVSWGMLLLGRAIQGVSSAGILNLIKIILADKVSLKENATNTTVFAWVGGIGYTIGPIVGGYLTTADWRYCFVLPIPFAVIAIIIIFTLLRSELVGPMSTEESGRRTSFLAKIAVIDYGGLVLFLFGVGLLILGTSWGGATYPWKSAAVLVSVVLGATLFISFFAYEYLMEPGRLISNFFPKQMPMIPIKLFEKRDLGYLVCVNFATGAALYSVFYFVGVYFVLVELYQADKAGVQLVYYIPGLGAGAQLSIFFSNVWPRQTFVSLWLGTLLEAVGIGVLTWALHLGRVPVIAGMMGLAGAGTGLRLMPATLHVAGIWPNKLASALSIQDFSLPFGGTIALAIMGSVFNNKFGGALANTGGRLSFSGQGHDSSSTTNVLDAIASLPPDERIMIQEAARDAVIWAFISITPILGLSLVAASFLGNVKITNSNKKRMVEGKTEEKPDPDAKQALSSAPQTAFLDTRESVTEGPYLLELVRGRKAFGKRRKKKGEHAAEEV
ncbi:MAG: hypothetical protein M1837_003199 [Sclerophora amabilis]|nr:MAG: hypothetical protein M1837_003199 [Sclerophora amabilis]